MADFAPAAFRSTPITLDVDGHPYTFPAMSAARWLELLSAPAWTLDVFRLTDDAAYEEFLARVDAGAAGPRDMTKVANAALAEAAGRSWWEALRLAHVATGAPTVLGSILLRGVDPERLTLAAFLAVVWVVVMQGRDDMARTQLEMELTTPPPEALEEEGVPEMDMATLVASMRAAPGVSVG